MYKFIGFPAAIEPPSAAHTHTHTRNICRNAPAYTFDGTIESLERCMMTNDMTGVAGQQLVSNIQKFIRYGVCWCRDAVSFVCNV